jgi:hypothetical protein
MPSPDGPTWRASSPSSRWFRYHHLFAQALNEELGRRYSERRPVLHRRAGAWFDARGDVDQAIRHAFAGGDLDTAATLVATHWIAAVNLGRLATTRGWLDTFPRPIVEADARLLLVEAWISGLQGDAEGGLRAVSAARRVGYEGEFPDGSGTVEESAALVRATFPWSDVGAMLSGPDPLTPVSASESRRGKRWPRSTWAGRSSSRVSQSGHASRSWRPSRWRLAVSSGWPPAMRGWLSPRSQSRQASSGRPKRGSAMP